MSSRVGYYRTPLYSPRYRIALLFMAPIIRSLCTELMASFVNLFPILDCRGVLVAAYRYVVNCAEDVQDEKTWVVTEAWLKGKELVTDEWDASTRAIYSLIKSLYCHGKLRRDIPKSWYARATLPGLS